MSILRKVWVKNVILIAVTLVVAAAVLGFSMWTQRGPDCAVRHEGECGLGTFSGVMLGVFGADLVLALGAIALIVLTIVRRRRNTK